MADKQRTRRIATAAMCAVVVLALVTPAEGVNGDYLEKSRIKWKPTFGWASPQNITCNGIFCHSVDLGFQWQEWPSLTRVDYDRTPATFGSYEHEVRFFTDNTGTKGRWCDPTYGTENEVRHLPPNSYYDFIDTDNNEFTWGVRAWRLAQNDLYEVYFECAQTTAGIVPNNEFHLTGQIGHCHTALPDSCTAYNTFPDETTRLIPRFMGRAPEVEYWTGSFAKNFSMEFAPGEYPNQWLVSNGTATRFCNQYNPYHGACY